MSSMGPLSPAFCGLTKAIDTDSSPAPGSGVVLQAASVIAAANTTTVMIERRGLDKYLFMSLLLCGAFRVLVSPG
ncbi:hypothetical protein GCM10022239_14840 [Leifsonia bigeumensis]|uniref:Uncharacterized protein n=1 Tax=Leifsonella bigeumensis TaxID=433643 RepID=A0ABP7FL31_9MICO